MASVVCQGLQSCLEPRLIEPSVVTHKPSSKTIHLQQKAKLESRSFMDNNGWGFLGVLENPSSTCVKSEEVYVHPMAKRSASALSPKSLEMCTESLGTETGSDVSESGDEFSGVQRSKARGFGRKVVVNHRRGGSFPPPLTSLSGGSDGVVKVQPHREGGRLVIKAVSVSDCGTKFEAERTNGRLKLNLLRDCCVNYESGRVEMKNEGGEKGCCRGEGMEEGGGGGWWRDMDGNRGKAGGKTGTDKLKRRTRFPNSFDDSAEFGLTRCKGGNGNKGITNWSSLQVAIS